MQPRHRPAFWPACRRDEPAWPSSSGKGVKNRERQPVRVGPANQASVPGSSRTIEQALAKNVLDVCFHARFGLQPTHGESSNHGSESFGKKN